MHGSDGVSNCSCSDCQGACQNKPGWFKPGEAEKAADFMGMDLKNFFNKKLGVDWYENPDIFLLAPAMKNMTPGEMYPGKPHGECVFYRDGKCEIHPVKPHQCRVYDHDLDLNSGEKVGEYNFNTAKHWDKEEHQEQVKTLLGRSPVAKRLSILDFL